MVPFKRGDLAAARLQTEESILLYREMGHRKALAESLAILARGRVTQREQSDALSLYKESLAIARKLKHSALIASCLKGIAQVVSTQEKSWWAALLLQQNEQREAGRSSRLCYTSWAGLATIWHRTKLDALSGAQCTMGKTSHMGVSSHAENGLPNCEIFPMRAFHYIGYTAIDCGE